MVISRMYVQQPTAPPGRDPLMGAGVGAVCFFLFGFYICTLVFSLS